MSLTHHRIRLSLLACAATLAVSASVAQASPIIDVYLLASTTSNGTYSSSLTNVTAGQTLYYEIAYKFIVGGTPQAPVFPTNANLAGASAITNYAASDGTGGQYGTSEDVGHSGLVVLGAGITESAGAQIQTSFSTIPTKGGTGTNVNTATAKFTLFAGAGNAGSGPWDYPAGLSGAELVYSGTGTNTGTSTARGTGFDRTGMVGVTGAGLAASGTLGFTAANTPVLVPLMAGHFTVTGVGTGAASTVNLSTAGFTATQTIFSMKYNGNYNDITQTGTSWGLAANFTVAQINGTDGTANDPLIAYHGLTLQNTVSGPTQPGQYALSGTPSTITIMAGDSTTITSKMTNVGVSGTNDPISFTGSPNWSGVNSVLGGITGGAVSGNPSPLATPDATGVTNTATYNSALGTGVGAAKYGTQVLTTTPPTLSSGANGAPVLSGSAGTVTIKVGIATAADGTTTGLTTFGAAIATSSKASGTLYGAGNHGLNGASGFGSETDGTSTNGAVTRAELLDGTAGSYTGSVNNNGGARTIQMAWRTRANNEMPNIVGGVPQKLTSGPNAGGYGVYSDAVQLSGLDGSTGTPAPTSHVQTDAFVLQMSVADAAFGSGGHSALVTAASLGFLYLGWLDDTTGTPVWRNAVDGNFINQTTVANPGDVKGLSNVSYNAYYQGVNGIGGTTNKTANTFRLGDWGYELTATGANVWAVLDHNSIFAAVPEPSSIVMMGFGLVGLVTLVRRRRNANIA